MASRLSSLRGFARAHPRLLIGVQLVVLGIFFGFVGWALRGSFHAAGNDLRNADPVYFVLACVAVAAYYLVFVLGWMRILADWDIHLTYAAALRAEMVSMLAITGEGAALGATLLNRVAITIVEVLLLVVGGVLLRRHDEDAAAVEARLRDAEA